MLKAYDCTIVDESFRVEFIRSAKEHVYWVSPKFTETENKVIDEIKNKLRKENVYIHKYEKSDFRDKGRCFSLEDDNRCIYIELNTKDGSTIYDSLLIVDQIACSYNHKVCNVEEKASFIRGISDIKLKEFKKEIERKVIQINFFGSGETVHEKELIENITEGDVMDRLHDSGVLGSNIIIKTDIDLKFIQDRICKVTIRTPGIRTDDRNIDISGMLNIFGKPDKEVSDRLTLRWKVFGSDIDGEYKKLQDELERIKDRYLISISTYGKFIFEKHKPLFEDEIKAFRKRLKMETKSIIRQRIEDSKDILIKLITNVYTFASSYREMLKTCSSMELELIKDYIKLSFPTVSGVDEKSDVELEYSSIEKMDILNKDFCRKLLSETAEFDKELAVFLEAMINS